MVNQEKFFVITKIRRLNYWTKDEDDILLKSIGLKDIINWKQIENNFENKNSIQCKLRYLKIKQGINHGHWKPEEDDIILKLLKQFGKKWAKISRIIGTRSSKQIRDRHVYYLDKSINKEKYSLDEDNHIKNLYLQYGPKWSMIGINMKGRTSASIKNRFNSYLSRKLLVIQPRKPKKITIYRKFLNLSDSSKENSFSIEKTMHFKLFVAENIINFSLDALEENRDRRKSKKAEK